MSISLSAADVTPLDPSKLKVFRASDEQMARMRQVMAGLYTRADVPPDPPYAEVTAGGKVIATVSSNGYVSSANALAGKIRDALAGESAGLQGPALAQQRAEKIAALFGGSVDKLATAMTQAEWAARPPLTWQIDFEAMMRQGYEVPPGTRETRFQTHALAADTIAALIREQEG